METDSVKKGRDCQVYDKGFARSFHLGGQQSQEIPLECWLDLRVSVQCGLCFQDMNLERRPFSGRCGHTVCSCCFNEMYQSGAYAAAHLLPCPYGYCKKPMSFERGCPNEVLLDSVCKLSEIGSKCLEIANTNSAAFEKRVQERMDAEMEKRLRARMTVALQYLKNRIQDLQQELHMCKTELHRQFNKKRRTNDGLSVVVSNEREEQYGL